MPALQHPEIFRSVLESLDTGVYLVDRERRIVFWNDGAERVTGYLRQDVVGRFCRDNILVHCDEKHAILCGDACPLADTMRDGKPRELSAFLRHKSGHRVPVWVKAIPLYDPEGTIIGAAESFDEKVSARQSTEGEDALPGYSSLDEKTAVPVPEFTESHLREDLTAFAGQRVPFSVLCIEIDAVDRFKAAYGQEAVSVIRHVVVETLKYSLSPADFLGCWRGNRFLAVLSDCAGAEAVRIAGERLMRMVSYSEIHWWGDRLSVTISLGGTTVRPADTMESLVKRIENSVDQSVKKGGSCVTACE